MNQNSTLTSKGERTRERLFQTALELFQNKSYEATTMRDIAATAECSLGLAYRYFSCKEDLVLALYRRMASDMETWTSELPPAPLVTRFEQAARAKIEQVRPYRALFRSLLGAVLSPDHPVGALSSTTIDVRERSLASFGVIVRGATDPLPANQARDMVTVLYAAHLGLLLFWLYDSSPDQRATEDLITFSRETLRIGRRLLRLPLFSRLLARLARAIEPVFLPEAPGVRSQESGVRSQESEDGSQKAGGTS